MPIEYKVRQLDVAAAGTPVVVILKPIRPDAAERAPAVLNKMAERGPRYRIGLIPSTTSRKWSFTDNPGAWGIRSFDISGRSTMEGIVEHVAGLDSPTPLSVAQAGEYLCISVDHGVGDSRVLTEVWAGVTHAESEAGFIEPLATPTATNPLLAALLNIAKASPWLLAKEAIGSWRPVWSVFRRILVALLNQQPTVASQSAGDHDPDERFTAVWVTSGPGFIEEVRHYRDSNHPGASVSAVMMLSIYRALQECGVSLRSELEFAVDLQRFLPANNEPFANFFSIARMNLGAQPSVEEFSAAVRLTARSPRTLLRLAGYLGVSRARALFARREMAGRPLPRPTGSGLATLLFSDTSNAPGLAKIAWARPEDAEIAIVTAPADQSHIAISICSVPNGSVQLTASFYASHIEKSLVIQALGQALASPAVREPAHSTSEPDAESLRAG